MAREDPRLVFLQEMTPWNDNGIDGLVKAGARLGLRSIENVPHISRRLALRHGK